MPVRRVPKHARSLTGLVPNTRTAVMTAFESSLERDCLLRLDFDPDVEFYEEQPMRIVYQEDHGRCRTYTPDVFVRYRTAAKPLLCEVTYRDDLRQHWTVYRPKFRAAQRYARQQGWRFRLVTERHVRTPYLENAKFLRPSRTLPMHEHHRRPLLDTWRGLRETAPATLLAAMAQDRWQPAHGLAALWQLVATRQVHTDLSQPLTMRSRLWLKEHDEPDHGAPSPFPTWS